MEAVGECAKLRRGVTLGNEMRAARKKRLRTNRRSTRKQPARSLDSVIEAYKKDVDRTLLCENLKLTVEERIRKLDRFIHSLAELRKAGRQICNVER